MQKLLDWFVYVILMIVGALTFRLSAKGRMKAGNLIGRLFMFLFPSRIKVAMDNLEHAYPEKDNAWHRKIIRGVFNNLGITLLEILLMSKANEEKLKDMVIYDNKELYQELHSRNKGVIFLSSHYGNWELAALAGSLHLGVNYLIIVEKQTNDFINQQMNRIRTRFGNRVVSRYSAAREIMNTLQAGGVLAIIADQSATKDKDVYVDFFGRPTATYESLAILALKFNVPIIFGVSVRQADGSYKVKLEEIKHDDLSYDKTGISMLTQRHVSALERRIREHPEHWMWTHRRWKHTEDYINGKTSTKVI